MEGKFFLTDYILFGLMLLLSTLVGVYYGFYGKKSEGEYLLGSKQMGTIPVAISLITSFVSGVTILAAPSDVYWYGPYFILVLVASIANSLFSMYVIMPVFYEQKVTSGYEYLKLRFGDKVRKFAALLSICTTFLQLPIYTYLPALALEQSTGLNVHLITPLVCGVCIFYTTLGGLKAVVWTDAIQFGLMTASSLIVIYIGTQQEGGLFEVFRTSYEGGRLNMSLDLDPTKKDTFWSALIGITFLYLGIGMNQAYVQKCLALPSMKKVRKMLWLYALGKIFFTSGSIYCGLLLYTRYFDCDPKLSKQINYADQILPLYVLEISKNIPGLAGLFIAGVFSASLSTMSGYLNALSCTVYRDFIAPFTSNNMSEEKINLILKLIVLITGIVCTGLVYVVQQLGNVMPLILGMAGIINGPMLGLFSLGLLFPMANRKGALYGSVSSFLILATMMIGSNYYKYKKIIVNPQLPVSVEGCNDFNFTNISTNTTQFEEIHEQPLYIFRISYYFYTPLAAFLVVFIGLIISSFDKADTPMHLISPVVRKFHIKEDEAKYLSVEKAMQMVQTTTNKA